MDKRIRIAGIIGALAFSAVILLSPSPGVPLPEPTTTSDSGNDAVIVLAINLDEPRDIAIHGTDVFVAEKSGNIRVVRNGTLLDDPLVTLRAAPAHDGGLNGITVHPDHADEPILYAHMTYVEDDALWNRIMWISTNGTRATDVQTILDRIPGDDFNNGGAIAFGPDGKLYVGTGATSDLLEISQDAGSLAGKILRLNDDGTIPEDNPTDGSAVYAIGFHDPQGIDWDSQGRLVISDIGPTKNDEINIVQSGANHGWPHEQCSGDAYADAAMCFDPGIGPSGLVVYDSETLAPTGSVIIASLRAHGIYAIDLDSQNQTTLLGGLGRIRDVAQDESGAIYAITSNTDNRGFERDGDDRLLRIVR